jgi:hypothetical protein
MELINGRKQIKFIMLNHHSINVMSLNISLK